ncbi:cation:proton antiporter domain-containing protein [Nocardia barduliensis]|uniref:cation:proton antiporter domain-containing protein n=1 Tax=Nocardia barduliensis TaxID=2736643 RepID=UPI001572F28D|nr:cation:proton antiporter [Nocardia barduliensis]
MRRILIAYLVVVAVPAALALLLIAPIGHAATAGDASPVSSESSVLPQVLIAIAVVVGAAAVGGALAERLGQARVFGELVMGLLLGPTALGAIAPEAQRWLFPSNILPHLDSMAQLGVVFFMFLVGMEVSHTDLRRVSATSTVIGHSSIALPFLGGVTVAWWLYSHYPPAEPGALPFALFIGLSFSITAFPVLARILDEQRLLSTRLGSIGMGAAGVCDLTAWCLLAIVVTIVHHTSLLPALFSIALAIAFTAAMFAVVRPVLARVVAQADRSATRPIALYAAMVCVLLVSALATEAIGVHPIFGAFLAGIVMPRESTLVADLGTKLEGVTLWVLLPLFFVTVGLRTDLGATMGIAALGTCGVIIVVAMATKMLGSGLAAVALGESRRDALAIGVMMNCRGLTELVVLNLGRQLGLLNSALFAMFVIMAVVTTAATAPLLRAVVRDRPPAVPAPRPAAETSR